MERQLKVPIDTMIITATRAAIGMRLTHSPRNTTISSRKMPVVNVDKRDRLISR